MPNKKHRNKKHLIAVYRGKRNTMKEPAEIIARVLRAEMIGNFNPIFCTYGGKRHLVQSAEGDLSDPFRRDETYLNRLYIELL